MKVKGNTKWLLLFIALGALLFSGCTANFITDIAPDGSGIFTQEYIMTVEELTSYGYTLGEDLCSDELGMDLSTMPPGTTVRQVESGEEIRCLFETAFADLDDLRFIYTDFMDFTVNDLRLEGGTLYYDLTINMGEGEVEEAMVFQLYWIVNMPGGISEHNAPEVSGNTLTWELPISGDLNARAIASAGGISSTWWWIIGISAFCLCLLVLVLVIVVVIVMVNRRKKATAGAG